MMAAAIDPSMASLPLAACLKCNLYLVCPQCASSMAKHHDAAECAALPQLDNCPSTVLLAFRLARLLQLQQTASATVDAADPSLTAAAVSTCSARPVALHDLQPACAPAASSACEDQSSSSPAAAAAAAAANVLTALLPGVTRPQILHAVALCANNAHAVSDPASHTVIGQAIFPSLSLFNHACAPSAYFSVATQPGRAVTGAVRARRALLRGDGVTLSYIPLHAYPRSVRRRSLEAKYGFRCACAECVSGSLEPVVRGFAPLLSGGAVTWTNGGDGDGGDDARLAQQQQQQLDEEQETEAIVEECEALSAGGRHLEAHLVLETQRQSLRALGTHHWLRARLLLALTHCQAARARYEQLAPTCAALLRALRAAAPLVDPLLLAQTLVYRAVALERGGEGEQGEEGGQGEEGEGAPTAAECLGEACDALEVCLGAEHSYTRTVHRMQADLEGTKQDTT
ncbi:hypothetical protein JKP88DRAFT_264653 [Tribonema minus]|uniref:SET domain-containing protein n=1 Tax=Tribonema minus TaxID=303371 RepID=A0A835YN82_9STRA|nr:hypothetical protein JKP88DRAFT_264653 [Tribonema minus]